MKNDEVRLYYNMGVCCIKSVYFIYIYYRGFDEKSSFAGIRIERNRIIRQQNKKQKKKKSSCGRRGISELLYSEKKILQFCDYYYTLFINKTILNGLLEFIITYTHSVYNHLRSILQYVFVNRVLILLPLILLNTSKIYNFYK